MPNDTEAALLLIIIPLFSSAARQFKRPIFEPSSVTVVLGELIGAPSIISVVLLGQTRRHA